MLICLYVQDKACLLLLLPPAVVGSPLPVLRVSTQITRLQKSSDKQYS
jgi:hypothetical protein